MCGRFHIDIEHPKIVDARLKLPVEEIKVKTTGEIFPTDIVPVFAYENGRQIVKLMQWGFPIGDKINAFNAKAETVLQNRAFRDSALNRRMVAVSTGFYEWQAVEGQKKKQKYVFKTVDSEFLYLAGIWNNFPVPEKGLIPEHFAILTTNANASVGFCHNRMPVIIREDEIEAWLTTDNPAVFLNRTPPELAACLCSDQPLNRQGLLFT